MQDGDLLAQDARTTLEPAVLSPPGFQNPPEGTMILSMTNHMRSSEPGVDLRGSREMQRIVHAAGRGPRQAEFAWSLVALVADLTEEMESQTALPAEEQELWESLGARFSDDRAVNESRERFVTSFAKLLSTSVRGDAEMAQHLGVGESRISQRISEKSLYAVAMDSQRLFPVWQFDEAGRALPKLQKVLPYLDPRLHPLEVENWFCSPNVDLRAGELMVSPRDWLITGGDPEVLVDLVPTR